MGLEILNALGGLGLFLLGMVILTNGLKELAGDTIRRLIAKFTKNMPSGIATGAIVTAVLQSSSATTVTAVGFASAGLLSLSQSLGIIFGANLGTTMTGWIVAVFGFKLKLGQIAFPLILVGTLMYMFARKRVGMIGFALAGFGLIFVGIDNMQAGMSGLADTVTPKSFPTDDWLGRILLILIGMGVSMVTQSSSAGMAMAITAVHTGTISLTQGVAMVVGFDMGTTVTAVIATLGGSVTARRTAFAHVLFNTTTACVAYFLVPLYMWVWQSYVNQGDRFSPEIGLALFHSLFNLLGILMLAPLSSQVIRVLCWLVPDAVNDQVERLEESFIQTPNVAIEASRSTLTEVFQDVLHLFHGLFTNEADRADISSMMEQTHETLTITEDYLRRVNVSKSDPQTLRCYQEVVLALDHIRRLTRRFKEIERLDAAADVEDLQKVVTRLTKLLDDTEIAFEDRSELMDEQPLEDCARELDQDQESVRRRFTEAASRSGDDFEYVLNQLDAYRWLYRISYHLWRTVHHLQSARIINGQSDVEPAEINNTKAVDSRSDDEGQGSEDKKTSLQIDSRDEVE
ncbi:Na/Pi cotransporter family protein [Gimesia chilikensis]|uniref:Na/Pi cotransporter family protein n=1 Tax=Gimesia chilikensis TaxID=2605989 RepID=UPI001187B356|nr:Na/Pi symporter [Gimesia chilikensis]QDT83641.1 Na+/Pi-cotransporter [Gimesia chilikensis]